MANIAVADMDVAHPKLRALYEYWLAKRGGRAMPGRSDLDPLEIGFVIGNVILIDVLPETPSRFRVRLHGSNLSKHVRFELTGKMLDQLPQTDFRDKARQTFTHVVRTRQPLRIRRDRILEGRRQMYETVVLPLSLNGEAVDMLLVGLIYDDEGTTVLPVWDGAGLAASAAAVA